jgi:hypothetical protein
MGRLTQAARASFQDHLNNVRTEYREAPVSKGRREAFDRLVEAWSRAPEGCLDSIPRGGNT